MVRVFRSFSARTALRASSRFLARGAPEPLRSPADRRRLGGFTLIEILVVVAVLSVLAALVAPNVFQHLGTAKDAAARSQMEMIGAALDAYRLDNGRYPTTAQGLGSLRQEPALEPRPRNWRGPYLRRELPMDPWGNPYVYVSPGDANPQGYDLVSFGADGALGGEGEDADLRSWD